MTLIWLAPLALTVGLVLGTLGGGGGILMVPILVYLVGLPPSGATTASLIIVSLTAAAGLLPHVRSGNVRLGEGLIFGAVGTLGALAGSRLSAGLRPAALMTAFGLLLLLVAALMIRRVRSGQHGGTGERRPLPLVAGTAVTVGFLTGLFGVGGGFAVVPGLVLALGYPMSTAAGTSLLVIIVNSVAALGSRVVAGVDINWPVVLLFVAFGAVGSVLGGRLASRANPKHLSIAFSGILVAVAAYTLAVSVPQLTA